MSFSYYVFNLKIKKRKEKNEIRIKNFSCPLERMTNFHLLLHLSLFFYSLLLNEHFFTIHDVHALLSLVQALTGEVVDL